MKRIIAAIMGILVIYMAIPQAAQADWRSYVWTYEYMTMRQDMFELEYYLTEQQPHVDESKPNTWKHWAELEYGITNHWDVAMYQRFKHVNKKDTSTFEYDGFKVRTRYRIAEKNKLPLEIFPRKSGT